MPPYRKYKRRPTYRKKRTYRKKASSKTASNATLTRQVKSINKRFRGGMSNHFKIEYQAPRQTLSPRWNKNIVIAPDQLHSSSETRAWKTVFSMDQSPTTLYQKPKAFIKGMKLIQHFRLADLAVGNTIDQPLVLHSYVIRCKQDAGAEWKQNTAGEWLASHLKQDLHYAMLGGNTAANVIANSAMFFLNKKCFTVLAQHHHTFGPYGLTQHTSVTGGVPVGVMSNLSRYEKTYVDWIPLNITLGSSGNASIYGNERGWTGITYQNVAATDQLLCINYVSQGDVGTVGSYSLTYAANGIIYGQC